MADKNAAKPLKEESVASKGKFAKLQKFDVYGRVKEENAINTRCGGLISLVAITIMSALFISELMNYLTVEVVDEIIVDTALNQKLPIGLNITFPRIRCGEVSVDTVDSMGENQVDNRGNLNKKDLDSYLQPTEGEAPVSDSECLSCLEATGKKPVEGSEGTIPACCNTCDDLKEAYMEAGLAFHNVAETAPQCKLTVGCRITGDVQVSKVAGNLHVALGRSTVRNGKLVHEFKRREVTDGFNTSHTIHRLEFGDQVTGMTSPLDSTTKTVHQGAYMFHYYVKLVPTLFQGRDKIVYTHQYSVTEKEKNVMVAKGELQGLPGVFIVYEFTPFMVQKSEKVMPFSHFLTSLCAIIGGVFTVAGRIDAILYKTYKKFGKFS